ncbi:hypothetical protein ABK040_004395 [Willaertia magna]
MKNKNTPKQSNTLLNYFNKSNTPTKKIKSNENNLRNNKSASKVVDDDVEMVDVVIPNSIIIDDPIEEIEDVIEMGENSPDTLLRHAKIFELQEKKKRKLLSQTKITLVDNSETRSRKLEDEPPKNSLKSLNYTPMSKPCVYPYNHHYSANHFFTNALLTSQPPTTSHLFYRSVSRVPLCNHIKQKCLRNDLINCFSENGSKRTCLRVLVDPEDNSFSQITTTMDVLGNDNEGLLVTGDHKGKITFIDLKQEICKDIDYDGFVSNVLINKESGNQFVASISNTHLSFLKVYDFKAMKTCRSIDTVSEVTDFKFLDSNTVIGSTKGGRLQLFDLRLKEKSKKKVKSSVSPSPMVSSPSNGSFVIHPKNKKRSHTKRNNTFLNSSFSDPLSNVSVNGGDNNYIFASPNSSSNINIYDVRQSLQRVKSIHVQSRVKDLYKSLDEKKCLTKDHMEEQKSQEITPKGTITTENGLVLRELTSLEPRRYGSALLRPPSVNHDASPYIKYFELTTNGNYLAFMTTDGGVGLYDILREKVTKYYKNKFSFQLSTFSQRGCLLDNNDSGLFFFAPYGNSIEVFDWSTPHYNEWFVVGENWNHSHSSRNMRLPCSFPKGNHEISHVKVMNPFSGSQKIFCSQFDGKLIYWENLNNN